MQKLIDGVLKILRRSEDSEGFLFFTTEQRAIGELMCSWETNQETGDVRRLVAIQQALVALIDKLDPKRRYTAGYELQPIELPADSPKPA